MILIKRLIFTFVTTILLTSCETDSIKGDLIITNANIWTGNSDNPKAEAITIKGIPFLPLVQ